MVEIKNWAGLPPHPTDEYVHWSTKEPIQKMEHLRELWKLALAGSEKCLRELLNEAYTAGGQDAHDT